MILNRLIVSIIAMILLISGIATASYQLPDNGAYENKINMSGNVLLMHFEDFVYDDDFSETNVNTTRWTNSGSEIVSGRLYQEYSGAAISGWMTFR